MCYPYLPYLVPGIYQVIKLYEVPGMILLADTQCFTKTGTYQVYVVCYVPWYVCNTTSYHMYHIPHAICRPTPHADSDVPGDRI